MHKQEDINKQIVLRFNEEVMQGGSLDALIELIHPDFVNHTAMPGVDAGRQGIIDFTINGMHKAMEDITVEIHDQVAENDKVVTRKTIHGTHVGAFMGMTPSGKRVQIKIMDIVTLKNGRYMEHWGIRDVQDLINKTTKD